MLRYLPEAYPFSAKMSALAVMEQRRREEAGEPEPEPKEKTEEDELSELVHDFMTYGETNRLISTLINRTSQGIEAQFEKKHRPNWPMMGPSYWTPKKKNNDLPAVSEEVSGTKDSVLVRAFAKMGGYSSG